MVETELASIEPQYQELAEKMRILGEKNAPLVAENERLELANTKYLNAQSKFAVRPTILCSRMRPCAQTGC